MLFTSADANPAPGDWRFINLTSTARECVIDHAIIQYAGLSQGYGYDGTPLNASDSLVLSNSTIRHSGRHGMVMMQGARKCILKNDTLIENNQSGLYSYNANNPIISIDGVHFLLNGDYGINIRHDVDFSIKNATFNANTLGTMVLHPNIVGGIDPLNTFTEPGKIEVTSGDITRFAKRLAQEKSSQTAA